MPIKLPESKKGKIAVAGGAAAALLVLILLFSGGSTPPAPTPAPAPAAAPTPTPAPVPAPVAAEALRPAKNKPVPPAPPNSENSKLILDLFSPSDQSLASQLSTTNVNQQIEQTMTITFVLARCQVISQTDYGDIFRALVMYAEATKFAPDAASAEAKVRAIASSSSASYSLVYSRVPCSDAKLPELANTVTKWAHEVVTKY